MVVVSEKANFKRIHSKRLEYQTKNKNT